VSKCGEFAGEILTRVEGKELLNRLFLALGAYVVLAVLSWATISDQKIRLVTLAVLAMFAVKTLLHGKDAMHADREEHDVET
jgi:hypothetical protein